MLKIEIGYSYIKPLFRYIDELVSCSCFPDLLERKLFPNAKELTESMAAYRVVRTIYRGFDLIDKEVMVVVVGDGSTPRTAALFAFRSAWDCYSVDPHLDKDKAWRTERLTICPKKIEELSFKAEKMVVVAVHSHANLKIADEHCHADQKLIIAIPCCVPQELDRPPDKEYVDMGIWSPKNTVKIWFPRK